MGIRLDRTNELWYHKRVGKQVDGSDAFEMVQQ